MSFATDIVVTGDTRRSDWNVNTEPPDLQWTVLNAMINGIKSQLEAAGWADNGGFYAHTFMQFIAFPGHSFPSAYPEVYFPWRKLGTFDGHLYVLWDPYSTRGGFPNPLIGDQDPTGQPWASTLYGADVIGIAMGVSADETIGNFIVSLTLNTPFVVSGPDESGVGTVTAKLPGPDYNWGADRWNGAADNCFSPPPRGGGWRMTSRIANHREHFAPSDILHLTPIIDYPGSSLEIAMILDAANNFIIWAGLPSLDDTGYGPFSSNGSIFSTFENGKIQAICDPYQLFIFDANPSLTSGGQNWMCSCPYIPLDFQAGITYSSFASGAFRSGFMTASTVDTATNVNGQFRNGAWPGGVTGVDLFAFDIGEYGIDANSSTGKPLIMPVLVGLNAAASGSETRIAGILWDAFFSMRNEARQTYATVDDTVFEVFVTNAPLEAPKNATLFIARGA